MANHCSPVVTLMLTALLLLSPSILSLRLPIAHADTTTLSIVNIQTLNTQNQACFYFCRGVDIAVFNISVENSGVSVAQAELVITMIDNYKVPIECFQSQMFSVNPGQINTILVKSSVIPSYAFVGIAEATVVLEDPSNNPITGTYVNYYIGPSVTPVYVFSGITVTPADASVIAGSSVNYTAIAYDSIGDYLDVSFGATWSINAQADGSWSINVYSAAKAGDWNVTVWLGTYSTSTSLVVTHGPAASIDLSPQTTSVTAGQSDSFGAVASDRFDNSWDVTGSAVFTIDSLARGSWDGNTYTAAKAGFWTVNALLGNIIGSTSLTVVHGAINSLSVSSKSQNLTAGQSLAFSATASDSYGNSWDVTSSATFTISSGAGGSWSGTTYTAAIAGLWIVSAYYSGFSNSASLTVTHALPVQIAVSSPGSITSGCLATFTANASDSYGNSWNVTSLATWSISSGAGGSWTGNTYNSTNLGNWEVTASYMDVQGNAGIAVYYPIDFLHTGIVSFDDLDYFVTAFITYYAYGILNPACDLNHDGTLNYDDLSLFVQYYIEYYVEYYSNVK